MKKVASGGGRDKKPTESGTVEAKTLEDLELTNK